MGELRTYYIEFKDKTRRVELYAKKHMLENFNILKLYDEKNDNVALINFETVEFMYFIENKQ